MDVRHEGTFQPTITSKLTTSSSSTYPSCLSKVEPYLAIVDEDYFIKEIDAAINRIQSDD